MDFIHVTRRDKGWHENFEISPFHRVRWNADQVIETWNNMFNLTYFEFRGLLREIVAENQKDLGFDKFINTYEISENTVSGLCVPSDEDDWFHPDLINVLKTRIALNPSRYYRWNIIKFSPGEIWVHQEPMDRSRILYNWNTNNFAIINPDFNLLDHFNAHYQLSGKGLEVYIPRSLSMYNLNMSSLSLLYPFRDDLKTKLVEFYHISKAAPDRHGEIPVYFEKLIDRMLDIYQTKLKLR